jgi:hypothetical protein
MGITSLPISPLSLDQLTRDAWGSFDALANFQLAPLAEAPGFRPKFVKAPADWQESIPGYGFVAHGMRVKPRSLIYSICLAQPLYQQGGGAPPAAFTLQVTDHGYPVPRRWFADPLSSLLLSNCKPTMQSNVALSQGSFPYLFVAPHPVVEGLLIVEIQSTVAETQRIQIVFGVLEACS